MLVRLQPVHIFTFTCSISYSVMMRSHPCLLYLFFRFAWSAAAVDYYLDPSSGRYFVEVPLEDDDDHDYLDQ